MYRKFLVPVAKLALAYLVICLLLYIFQRSMIYFPTGNQAGTEKNTQVMTLADASIVLNVRLLDSPNALIYFGGNGEDVSWSLAGLSEKFPDYAIYLMNYRGYGGSSGKPAEEVLHADALSLFDKVHAEHPNITVVGRSLGSGVAVRLASIRPVERLVLITPYDSIENIAAQRLPYIPVRWLLKDKFESWRYAPSITAPTEIIAAGNDEVIPLENTQALFRTFKPGIATMNVIPGATHNSVEY